MQIDPGSDVPLPEIADGIRAAWPPDCSARRGAALAAGDGHPGPSQPEHRAAGLRRVGTRGPDLRPTRPRTFVAQHRGTRPSRPPATASAGPWKTPIRRPDRGMSIEEVRQLFDSALQRRLKQGAKRP